MDNYIPSGKWPSFLALSIIFFSSSSLSMRIFLTPRFEKTQNASSRKNEDVSLCLSVCLSVCLSLARASWQRRANDTTKAIAQKKRLVSRRLTAAQKKATNSRVVCREKKKKRTNANEFCLFTAQFYVQKRLNDVIFGFFLSCARVCVS